jgi:hypothetical protein
MGSSDASSHLEGSCGKLQMLTEVLLQHCMLMQIMSSLGVRTVLYVFGQELTESFLFNSTVRKLNNILLIFFIDQKKDIVSLFPDINKPYLIHSCSMDRSISTYDLKLEKRNGGHQTKNGSLFGMT